MPAVGPITGTRTISPIGPLPAGVKPPSTPEQEALYDSCKQFEGVFVKQLVSGWMKSARGDDAPSGAQGIYQDMADDTMTASLVDGGTFGLAGTMYAQLSTLLQGHAAARPAGRPGHADRSDRRRAADGHAVRSARPDRRAAGRSRRRR
jgi:Rod binding domain-containing protein